MSNQTDLTGGDADRMETSDKRQKTINAVRAFADAADRFDFQNNYGAALGRALSGFISGLFKECEAEEKGGAVISPIQENGRAKFMALSVQLENMQRIAKPLGLQVTASMEEAADVNKIFTEQYAALKFLVADVERTVNAINDFAACIETADEKDKEGLTQELQKLLFKIAATARGIDNPRQYPRVEKNLKAMIAAKDTVCKYLPGEKSFVAASGDILGDFPDDRERAKAYFLYLYCVTEIKGNSFVIGTGDAGHDYLVRAAATFDKWMQACSALNDRESFAKIIYTATNTYKSALERFLAVHEEYAKTQSEKENAQWQKALAFAREKIEELEGAAN